MIGRCARLAFVAMLAVVAARHDGPPSAASLAAMGLTLGLFALPRIRVLGRNRATTELRAPLLVAGALLIAAGAAALAGSRGRLAMPWVTLVAVPLALRLCVPGDSLIPRGRPLALLWALSLALGLVATAPWGLAASGSSGPEIGAEGVTVLALLAWLGVALVAFDRARGERSNQAPPPARAEVQRAAAIAALTGLSVLLFAAPVAWLLSLGGDPDRKVAPREPPPDLLSNRITPAESPTPEPDPQRVLALIRTLSAPDAEAGPLLLRERLLDAPEERDGLLFLAAKRGESRLLRDEEDGAEDRRVAWPESGRSQRPASEFQITLLTTEPTALLLVEPPRFVEAATLQLDADGAVARPDGGGGTFTYRLGADPEERDRAANHRESIAAAVDADATALPDSFADRRALDRLLAPLLADAPDDLSRAYTIERMLRRSGRVDAEAPFRSWREFLAARGGRPLHFAQCGALLCRLAKIPARVVVGYRVESVAVEGRREVRASDRHYWFEAKFERFGWLPFDPSPPLAVIPPSEGTPAPIDDEVSGRTLRSMISDHRPFVVGLLLALLLALLLSFPEVRLKLEALLPKRAPPGVHGPARRAWRYWQELLDCCSTAGLHFPVSATAEECAHAIASAAPAERSGVVSLLGVYHACRFGGAPLATPAEQEARSLLRRLPQALAEWRPHSPAPDRSRR